VPRRGSVSGDKGSGSSIVMLMIGGDDGSDGSGDSSGNVVAMW
jgi:hypothetical protein